MSGPDQTRTAVYLRVSTPRQGLGFSIGTQRELCQGLIAQRGWHPIAEYVDDGASGATNARPALHALLAECRNGAYDAVVVPRLDRFGRSVRHLSTLLAELDHLGVDFVSATEQFDSQAVHGRLQRNILAVIAQFERDLIIDRSRAAARFAAQRGYWPGGVPPFGFATERSGHHHVLCIEPTEAATICRLVDLIVDDRLPFDAVADRLNAEGRRPRRGLKFSRNTVEAVAHRAPLAGRWFYARNTDLPPVAVDIPPIITLDRYLELRAALHTRRLAPHHQSNTLSAGILYGLCGRRCRVHTIPETGRRVYRCGSDRRRPGPCGCPAIDADNADAYVWRIVSDVLRAEVLPPTVDHVAAIERADLLIQETAAALARATFAVSQLDISTEALDAALEDVAFGARAAQEQRRRLERSWPDDLIMHWRLNDIATRYANRLEDLTPAHIRGVYDVLGVQAFVASWDVCPTCRGKGSIPRRNSCLTCHRAGVIPDIKVGTGQVTSR